ncbi:carbohydrate-binding module family 21 protein [Paxillus involutus ATCC 200175]|uniref:Carbohydrate-binding module family 21 protein n=1 Tax=Paxillus involutus ATCC 200175 TaxID=664439 RepID=A0A0C9TE36_PAXIN|nr:carbohydrate-binding module family 21 protein [Paxillus involutus ATCC 200175]
MLCSVPDIRRSHSSTPSFSDERGPGAFASLGSLPRRKSSQTAPPTRKSPVFHLNNEHDDYSSSDSVDDHPLSVHSPPSSPPKNLSGSDLPPASVPFPCSTSPSPSPLPSPSLTHRPPLARGLSSPIVLSNGKPLKSSLKSCSTPSMASDSQPQYLHLRARSEPSSPVILHKNVHFPDQEGGLATVRLFNRSARPAALSNPASNNGEETETEGDDAPPNRFPFPAIPPTHYHYEIDPVKSSPVPSHHSSQYANVHIDSLVLSPSPSSVGSKPQLSGSVLVRNLAFEKHVAIRFTLDEWQTVSEVSAHYLDSIPALPSHVQPSSDRPPQTGWDRFTFNIRLEDYAHSLSTRVLWLAARYRVNYTHPGPDSSPGEWWDNNSERNYRVSFRPALSAAAIAPGRPRRDTSPAHMFSSQNKLTSPFTRGDRALGISASSRPSNEISSPTSFPGSKDRHPTAPHAGKLSLSNYASPMTRPILSVSSPSDTTAPRRRSPPPLITSVKPAPPFVSNRDESPASSTLSTPSLSPTIHPHVILGGHPVTSMRDDAEEHDVGAQPTHLHDWEWSATTKRPIARSPPRQFSDSWPVPGVRVPGLPGLPNGGGKQGLNNESLYKAFVTQWCFAQEPSPNHAYGSDGGVLA